MLPGDSMEVMLADENQLEALETCLASLVMCSAYYQVLYCVVKCHVLLRLNHDIVLSVDCCKCWPPGCSGVLLVHACMHGCMVEHAYANMENLRAFVYIIPLHELCMLE